jgi:hypothetical protein
VAVHLYVSARPDSEEFEIVPDFFNPYRVFNRAERVENGSIASALHAALSPPHLCLLLLAESVSPAHVQEQLGRATIELSVSTYGRWLRKRAPGAVGSARLSRGEIRSCPSLW